MHVQRTIEKRVRRAKPTAPVAQHAKPAAVVQDAKPAPVVPCTKPVAAAPAAPSIQPAAQVRPGGGGGGALVPSQALVIDPARDQLLQERMRLLWGVRRAPARYNPAPNPVSLSRRFLREMRPDEYVVAEKTDGVRYQLMLCRDAEQRACAVMIDRACRKYEVRVCAEQRYYDGTLLDGELVLERAAGATAAATARYVYWAFDAVALRGESLRECSYATRFEALHAALHDPDQYPLLPPAQAEQHAQRLAAAPLQRIAAVHNAHSLCLRPKQCVSVRNLDALWRSLPALAHRNDGLLFTPLHDALQTGTTRRLLKYKFEHTFDLELRGTRRAGSASTLDGWVLGLFFGANDHTVAFAHEVDAEPAAVAPYVEEVGADGCVNACRGVAYRGRCVCFVLQRDAALERIVALARDAPALRCIVECTGQLQPDGAQLLCRVLKVRTDKTVPNNSFTIKQTLLNLEERIPYEEVRAHMLGVPYAPAAPQ